MSHSSYNVYIRDIIGLQIWNDCVTLRGRQRSSRVTVPEKQEAVISASLTRQRHQIVVDDVQPCALPWEELNMQVNKDGTITTQYDTNTILIWGTRRDIKQAVLWLWRTAVTKPPGIEARPRHFELI